MCSQKNGGVPNKVTPPEMELRVTAHAVQVQEDKYREEIGKRSKGKNSTKWVRQNLCVPKPSGKKTHQRKATTGRRVGEQKY